MQAKNPGENSESAKAFEESKAIVNRLDQHLSQPRELGASEAIRYCADLALTGIADGLSIRWMNGGIQITVRTAQGQIARVDKVKKLPCF